MQNQEGLLEIGRKAYNWTQPINFEIKRKASLIQIDKFKYNKLFHWISRVNITLTQLVVWKSPQLARAPAS